MNYNSLCSLQQVQLQVLRPTSEARGVSLSARLGSFASRVSVDPFSLFLLTSMVSLWIAAGVLAVVVKAPVRVSVHNSNFLGHLSSKTASSNIATSKSGRRLDHAKRAKILSNAQFLSEIIGRTNGKLKGMERGLAMQIVLESLISDFDPLLVAAIIKSESTFDRHATSNRGALGLMQLLPNTARYISTKTNQPWHGSGRLQDSDYNIRLGVAYLKYLEKKYHGNKEHALIAYNWGPANLTSALNRGVNPPRQVVRYARGVLATYSKWRLDLETRTAQLYGNAVS